MMNRTQAQELAHIIRSDADWLNVSVRHASEVYNLVAPESELFSSFVTPPASSHRSSLEKAEPMLV